MRLRLSVLPLAVGAAIAFAWPTAIRAQPSDRPATAPSGARPATPAPAEQPATVPGTPARPATSPSSTSPPLPGTAPSTGATPKAPPSALGGRKFKGLDMSLSLGLSATTDDVASGRDPLVYLRMHVLYRLMKYFGVGLHWSFNFHDPESSFADPIVWSMMLGVEARGYFPWKKLDVFVAISMGYFRDGVDSDLGDVWTDGFGFGTGFGARWFLLPVLALGVELWVYANVTARICSKGGGAGQQCNDIDVGDVPDGAHLTFGFFATFFLPL